MITAQIEAERMKTKVYVSIKVSTRTRKKQMSSQRFLWVLDFRKGKGISPAAVSQDDSYISKGREHTDRIPKHGVAVRRRG